MKPLRRPCFRKDKWVNLHFSKADGKHSDLDQRWKRLIRMFADVAKLFRWFSIKSSPSDQPYNILTYGRKSFKRAIKLLNIQIAEKSSSKSPSDLV